MGTCPGMLVRRLGAGALAALLACRPEASAERRTTEAATPAPEAPPAAPVPSAPDPGGAPVVVVQRPPGGHGAAARYPFDFEDADLPALVKLVGGITGKRFILTGKLPVVHATVHAPEPVTADEAYEAFLTILQANGLTVVRRGELWAIRPSPGVPPEPAGR